MGCSRPALGPLCLLLTTCTTLGSSEDILEPMPPVTPLDDLPQDERIEGTWVSNDCGARVVPRRIVFEPSGRFLARDEATPCTPPEECTFQGIDSRSGIWTIDDDGRIALLVQEGAPAALGAPFPEQLQILAGNVTELGPLGEACVYQKLD